MIGIDNLNDKNGSNKAIIAFTNGYMNFLCFTFRTRLPEDINVK